MYTEKDPVNMVFRLLGFSRASEGIRILSITAGKQIHARVSRSVSTGLPVIRRWIALQLVRYRRMEALGFV